MFLGPWWWKEIPSHPLATPLTRREGLAEQADIVDKARARHVGGQRRKPESLVQQTASGRI
eukprot:5343067-Alexandrium_andersonii.AAC.1